MSRGNGRGNGATEVAGRRTRAHRPPPEGAGSRLPATRRRVPASPTAVTDRWLAHGLLTHPGADGIVTLQRLAGNRAVNAALTRGSRGRAPVVQRRIATRAAAAPAYTFGDATGRYEDSRSERGAGYKPLLVVPVANVANVELHVHLIPRTPPTRYTGWNFKNTTNNQHIEIDNTTRDVDAEDQALFGRIAPNWQNRNSYPNRIIWANAPRAEREAAAAAAAIARLEEKREEFASILEQKRAGKVRALLRDEPITLTISATTRARKRRGGGRETHAGFETKVKAAKPDPELEGVTAGKHTINDNGQHQFRYVFDGLEVFEARRAAVVAAMTAAPDPPKPGLQWAKTGDSDDRADLETALQGPLDDYIAAVRNGDHDVTVRRWGWDRGGVRFPDPG